MAVENFMSVVVRGFMYPNGCCKLHVSGCWRIYVSQCLLDDLSTPVVVVGK
jgi:hypothetical protein